MTDVFISYSRKDRTTANDIRALLEEQRWDVWLDDRLTIGNEFSSEIEAKIDEARIVLVIWSDSAVTSEWVKAEARRCRDKGAPDRYMAVHLSKAPLPLPFGEHHAIDFRSFRPGESDRAAEELLAQLRARLGLTTKQLEDVDALAHRRMRRRLRQFRSALGIAFVVAASVLVGHGLGALDGFYGGTTCWRTVSHQVRAALGGSLPQEALSLVVIDRKTESELGGKPLPDEAATSEPLGDYGINWRYWHGEALRALADAGARSVAFDVAFSPRQAPLESRVARGTRHLAEAVRYARARGTAVSIVSTARDARGELLTEPELHEALSAPLTAVSGREIGVGRLAHSCIAKNDGVALVTPLVLLSPNGTPEAHSLALSLMEGFVHRELAGPPQALTLRLSAVGAITEVPIAGRGARLRVSSKDCPAMTAGYTPVDYMLPSLPRAMERGNARFAPYEAVVARRELHRFSGKAVLIGTDRGRQDQHPVTVCDPPLHCKTRSLPGLALHAATTDGLLAGRALRTLGLPGQFAWLLLVAILAVYASFATLYRSFVSKAGLILLLVATDLALALWTAVALDIASDALYHVGAIGAAFLVVQILERLNRYSCRRPGVSARDGA